jgi:hypothetical protein
MYMKSRMGNINNAIRTFWRAWILFIPPSLNVRCYCTFKQFRRLLDGVLYYWVEGVVNKFACFRQGCFSSTSEAINDEEEPQMMAFQWKIGNLVSKNWRLDFLIAVLISEFAYFVELFSCFWSQEVWIWSP